MKTHWLHMNESQPTIRGGYENLCVFIHPSLQELAGIHLILFWYPAQAAQIPVVTGIVLWRLESSVNSTGQVRYFLPYSLDHLHPVTQLENILWDECLQKKKKKRIQRGERRRGKRRMRRKNNPNMGQGGVTQNRPHGPTVPSLRIIIRTLID